MRVKWAVAVKAKAEVRQPVSPVAKVTRPISCPSSPSPARILKSPLMIWPLRMPGLSGPCGSRPRAWFWAMVKPLGYRGGGL